MSITIAIAPPCVPTSPRCCRRMRRAETIASSDIAKKPFKRISPRTSASYDSHEREPKENACRR